MSSPGYANLLAHLHNTSTSLPLPTIQSALAHHLAELSPLPTPLAATTVSSPLFLTHPFTHPKLQTLLTAFRHATHLKYRSCKNADKQAALSSIFAMSTKANVKHWAAAVLKGIKGGQPILRLACCGGLLAGLEDLKIAEDLQISRSHLEDEVVISVAESMDTYLRPTTNAGGWETEFQPVGDVDTMTLALILASQCLALVAPQKLKALPLSSLAGLLTFTVTSTFASGTFLSAASSSTSRENILSSTTLRTINESPLMEFIAPISKLTALILNILTESRPVEGMGTAVATLEALRPISKSVESDWVGGVSAQVASTETTDMQVVWATLKTLLFANIMIADAALSATIFVPPAAYSRVGPTPSTLALTVLHILSNLSFVISQFGGVTTTASPGFVELKKTFYLALDILAKSEEESNRFVHELYLSVREWQGRKQDQDSDVQAKQAYALTCIEQLVPVLSGDCIQSYALPLSLPQLSDPSHREVYESSHSVVLAIFASHADHADHHAESQGNTSSDALSHRTRFTERLVPFYAHCLIENSIDGRLSTAQLRLAFASLVRSACVSAPVSAADHNTVGDVRDDYTLAWYCIDALLATIHDLSTQDNVDSDRLHRLHLTLVSVVPTLPLKLLPRVLEEVRAIITTRGTAQSDGGKMKELVDATFVEILERVGDREKEYAMRWWYDNRSGFRVNSDETPMAVARAECQQSPL